MKARWAILLVLSLGCSSPEKGQMTFTDEAPQQKSGAYEDVVEYWTRSDRDYSAFAASFQITATLHSTPVLDLQLKKDAKNFQWSPEKYQTERTKAQETSQSETSVFASFYTAKDENNNLDKTETDWNIFLEVGGRRYNPIGVKRVFTNMQALNDKYPYHTVWNRAYLMRFAVPTSTITQQKTSLTISGPIGKTTLEFSN